MANLIAFDLDGVLLDGKGSWMELHKFMGTEKFSEENGRQYYSGKIPFDEWVRRDIDLWKGFDANKISEAGKRVEVMKGIEVIKNLSKNYKMAIISGGIKQMANKIFEKCVFDHCYANEIIVKDEKIFDVDMKVNFENKGEILEEIAGYENVGLSDCIAIGDFINDIPMFKKAGFSIAFNPKHNSVVENADVVIRNKDLREILRYL
ncbi:MAG: HAD-IB family phosphatase [Candidatus Altiarchaeum hamiconexum]|uniref:phosphoserine phosphatase n=1 Tax=Candidatus Altarchaeum hamiconexum TaxID=1803513 RepID=A0A8J7Z1T6_9ARCH|nr:HAD-IB family phosphatase [Candidatus Altarchaeum hamiconexum]OIQ05325.1 MAG: hypothetical protein AUK59_04355 [Candidatus Altarchaeum sp. CG2_30_32_3053]PIN67600.1 MAG: phosphoserine phosphatase SerB [Candidatus Altarchaeum sp. CG12_big_fil_rev_8_21_14_0_65_33_22]PIV27098.1 MAG: phosphoserine phosphatase SerB [Candidatus Altarchaeum sp. CG03_land_8_20_14_0_80_32_618]PIX48930.1 MAG: phosphoserine phosphatase SerB [Candidatus Altarchaeum sp. CG_4_8_14_3_um_filter_33_2054]PIZ31716.1 MAG: phos